MKRRDVLKTGIAFLALLVLPTIALAKKPAWEKTVLPWEQLVTFRQDFFANELEAWLDFGESTYKVEEYCLFATNIKDLRVHLRCSSFPIEARVELTLKNLYPITDRPYLLGNFVHMDGIYRLSTSAHPVLHDMVIDTLIINSDRSVHIEGNGTVRSLESAILEDITEKDK